MHFMWAQVIHNPGEMHFEKRPLPVVGDHDLLVKVEATLTCGTDLKTFCRGHPLLSFPVTVGHEYAGTVAAVGRKVTGFDEGDRVATVHSGPCQDCFYCRRGLENLCSTITERMVWGGFAEYVKIPPYIHRVNTMKIPRGLSYTDSAFLEPVACVLYGMKKLDLTRVQNAVILGAGPIGLLFLQRLKRAGVENVMMAGKHEVRLEKAGQFAADHVFDAEREDIKAAVMDLTHGYGTDLVVECVGRTQAWELAMELVAKAGQVLFYGGCPAGTKVVVDTRRLHYDELTLKGAFHFTPREVREAFDLISTGEVVLDPLVSGEFSLCDLPQAFDELLSGNGIKYLIRPEN